MNYLIIVLDSARYDCFVTADTPNFDKVGKPLKAHSQSPCTIYSIMGYLYNLGPVTSKVVSSDKGKYVETNDVLIPEIPKHTWLPSYFQKKGYYTGLLTGNPMVYSVFRRVYDHGWNIFEGYKYGDQYCMKEIVDDLLELTEKEPYFLFVLPMDTHFGYYDGKEAYGYLAPWFRLDLEKLRRFQIKSIEYCDKQFGRLLPKLRDCRVIITSDHGDMHGEHGDVYGVNVRHFGHGIGVVSPILFRVPLIRGEMKNI